MHILPYLIIYMRLELVNNRNKEISSFSGIKGEAEGCSCVKMRIFAFLWHKRLYFGYKSVIILSDRTILN